MNESLRDRIIRHLEPLSDERGYQVLDYIEFLESKYAGTAAASPGLFQRFTEGVEDTLRAGKVSTTAIAETMGLLTKAVGRQRISTQCASPSYSCGFCFAFPM
jgi:hypothetical protein